ncbi:MAG: shikimate dehydrogenase [Actinomycetes bacterium]
MISGATRVAAVVGDPVRHSLSPIIHNAAFGAVGLDWVFVAFEVPTDRGGEIVPAMDLLGIDGLSVTMAHKAAVSSAVDDLTDVASRLESVNCVVRRHGRTTGTSTDGAGFLWGLQQDFDVDPAGLDCVVLGAGGAARAVAHALAGAGASSVGVVNRTRVRAERAAELAGSVGAVVSLDAVSGADLVVNATPVGMGGDASSPVPAALLGAGQVVVDLVYHPADTPLMAVASAAGARAGNGLSMLVGQAAAAFELWTGEVAPTAVMLEAAAAQIR